MSRITRYRPITRRPRAATRPRAGIAQVEFIVLFCSICLASVISWMTFGEIIVQIIGGD